jgi:hypothetical protein
LVKGRVVVMSFDEIELTQKLVQTPGLSGAEGEVADRVEDKHPAFRAPKVRLQTGSRMP